MSQTVPARLRKTQSEEVAFYDALADYDALAENEMVKKMPKLDWTRRESVRADLRRSVRRLLARYGYAPDLAEGATQLVLRQAELSTENAE